MSVPKVGCSSPMYGLYRYPAFLQVGSELFSHAVQADLYRIRGHMQACRNAVDRLKIEISADEYFAVCRSLMSEKSIDGGLDTDTVQVFVQTVRDLGKFLADRRECSAIPFCRGCIPYPIDGASAGEHGDVRRYGDRILGRNRIPDVKKGIVQAFVGTLCAVGDVYGDFSDQPSVPFCNDVQSLLVPFVQ